MGETLLPHPNLIIIVVTYWQRMFRPDMPSCHHHCHICVKFMLLLVVVDDDVVDVIVF